MPGMGQPDYLNQLFIPLGADLLSFIIKAIVVTLLAGFFMKRYIVPLFKKENKQTEEIQAAQQQEE